MGVLRRRAPTLGGLLKELPIVHEHARRAMRSMVLVVWPNKNPPQGMAELLEMFKGARRCFKLWKTSACREGALEVWAMVNTRFAHLEPEHMAQVGPARTDGKEIPLHLVYDQVMPATRLSQEDCTLDAIIDHLD